MDDNSFTAVDYQNVVLALLEHIREPVYVPKGDKQIVLAVSVEGEVDVSIEDEEAVSAINKNEVHLLKLDHEKEKIEKEKKVSLFMKSAEETITLKPIPKKPNLATFKELDRSENISLFNPFHKELAAELTTMLMKITDLDEFFATAAYCRDEINSNLFFYSFSVAILHRKDTRNLRMPPYAQIFPDKFVDSNMFPTIIEEVFLDKIEEWELEKKVVERRPTVVRPQSYLDKNKNPFMATSTDLEPESRLAYFREDMGVNLHHWHWHTVYPAIKNESNIVNKDRRGELFYYMHQQIVARYDFERLCNQLPRVRRLTNLREPIEEGYFPKICITANNQSYAGRPSGTILQDVNRIQKDNKRFAFDIDDLERWKNRIYDAIQSNCVQKADGTTCNLDIDTLGNMIEAVENLSPNYGYYGDLHNFGHIAIAYCHDPDNRHLQPEGVMFQTETAMRDPIFYRWHAFINDMFVAHKNTLSHYTEEELNYEGIHVTSLELITPEADENTIKTLWEESPGLELSRGLNFNNFSRPVEVTFTRLQHKPFQYRFKVRKNTLNGARKGTVRIFLAPKSDEHGQTMHFADQKNLFVELDRYIIDLNNDSVEQVFERESAESSVTIPPERTFHDIETKSYGGGTSENKKESYCGCGWPENMLVPKGNAEGFNCVLFVMVSNYEDDKVEQAPGEKCSGAPYCGVRDKLYPDRRSMGFPFDRKPKKDVTTLEEFLTPNMTTVDVKIQFKNED